MLERPGGDLPAADIGEFALGPDAAGLRLRPLQDQEEGRRRGRRSRAAPASAIVTADDGAAKKAWRAREAVAAGVVLARDLVNEPPNVLTPEEFAKRAEALEKLGVEVEVLDPKALKKLGMSALLGVAQGSNNQPRVVVMRWNGAGGRRQAAGLRRQGGDVRFRRHLDQAGRQHGGHEGRHGRRRRRGRADARAGRPQGQGRRGRRGRPGREHAGRRGPAPRRHRHLAVGPDHRDHQHRRRGPPRAGRRPLVRQGPLQAGRR